MILVTPHRYDANSGCIVGIRFSFKKGSQTFTIQLYMDLFGPFGWISPFPTIWYGTKDTTWLAEIHSTIPRNDRNRSPGHVVLLEQTISQRVRLKLVCLAFSFRVLDYSTQCLQTELLHQSKPSIVWAKIINPGQNQFNCTGAETQKKTFHCSETIIIAKTMKHNKREFQHIFFPCMYIYIIYKDRLFCLIKTTTTNKLPAPCFEPVASQPRQPPASHWMAPSTAPHVSGLTMVNRSTPIFINEAEENKRGCF